MTQEEDVAFAQALGSLDRVGRANASRLIVMRSASDYCYAPDGAALQPWFFHDDTHMAGREAKAYDRAIDNQVSRLRRKIEDDPKQPRLIVTEWGGGYLLAADVEVVA